MKYIYGLVDPRTRQIRYIGQADDLFKRLQQHLSDSSNTPKVEWIRGLKAQNTRPEIVQLAVVPDEENAHLVEYRWIYFARKNGWQLTNTSAMRTEEYYSLQGYFERLIVEMEKPEGVSEPEYTMRDVRKRAIRGLVRLIDHLPQELSNKWLKASNSNAATSVFCILCFVLYLAVVFTSIKSTEDNIRSVDVIFVISTIVCAVSTLVIVVATNANKDDPSRLHTHYGWWAGCLFIGLTIIARLFL